MTSDKFNIVGICVSGSYLHMWLLKLWCYWFRVVAIDRSILRNVCVFMTVKLTFQSSSKN